MTTQHNYTSSERARHIRNLNKYGYNACQACWETCVLDGEGPTMQAINSGLHFNATSAAIAAYTYYLRQAGIPTTAREYLNHYEAYRCINLLTPLN